MRKIVDLHSHSLVSDGACSPIEVVENAYKNNVQVLSLTDHDSIAGILKAREESKKYNIEFIPGIEITTLNRDGQMLHILGYNMDISNEMFQRPYTKIKKAREATMEKIIKIIEEKDNIKIDINELNRRKLDKYLSRFDIHRYIVEKGICTNSREAWNTIIDPIPFEEDEIISVNEAISMIANTGGQAFLAHYNHKVYGLGRFCRADIETELNYLISLGLSGIERYYPTFTKEEEAYLDYLIEKYNLKCSGGTDYHGYYRGNNDIGIGDGSFFVEYEKTFLNK